MLHDKRVQELTKSERLILDLISEVEEYDYSMKDTSDLLDISKQTVYRGFKKLLNLGFVTKEVFYEKNIKRCRYKNVDINISISMNGTSNISSINDTSNIDKTGNNVTGTSNKYENVTSTNTLEESSNQSNRQGWVESLGYKKRLAPKLTSQTLNDCNSDIYNKKYISNQSKDITELDVCQVKKIQLIDEFVNTNSTEGSITKALKIIAKKIFCEKNQKSKSVARFFEKESKEEQKEVFWGVVRSVTRRMLDKTKAKIRNLYGYIRIALVNAVETFYVSKVEESEAKTVLYESVKQLHCSPAPSVPATSKNKIDCSSLAHNFEQREYDEGYWESFYKNDVATVSPATSATVKSKIDTRYLSRNFEQREYSEEYYESLYETFEDDVDEVPATFTPAKDIVMEQVRAMRDSFGKNGRIKPLPCVDLW